MEKEKMTDDLIRRQDVIDIIEGFGLIDGYTDTLELTKDILQLPLVQHDIVDIAKVTMAMAKKADMVAVVRCKDCKHYVFAEDRAFGFPVKRCEVTGFEDVDDYDFCSRAERRNDGKAY